MNRFIMMGIAATTVILIGVIVFYIQMQMAKEQMKNCTGDSEKWMERMYVENNIYESVRNNDCVFVIPTVSKETTLLVCYYSSLSCGTCVNFAMSKIDEYFLDSEQNPQIVFIASDFNERTNVKRQNTIRLSSRNIEMPINESAVVCYFILQNNIVSHFFIPEKEFDNYTNVYLTEVRKKFFREEN